MLAIDFDAAVARFRGQVLQVALRESVPTDVAAAALADVLGQMASLLDQTEGSRPLEARLAPLLERIRVAHGRMGTR